MGRLAGTIGRFMNQTITYWAPPADGNPDEFGDYTYQSAASISGRWEIRDLLFINRVGTEEHSHAIVYTATAVDVDGFLYLGTSTASDPTSVDGADRIRQVERIWGVKGIDSMYKVLL